MPEMHRKQLLLLDKWSKKAKRKPLILRGARQVGKSTLVRMLADELKMPLNEVNLERFSALDSTFERLDVNRIIDELEAIPNIGSIDDAQILFLDEIQATPNAIAALRYFYEDKPHVPVIAAGSLLEFALSDHTFSMPVGRIEYLHMGPMTFSEFLGALGEGKLVDVIQRYQIGQTIGPVTHSRLLELLRIYCIVGGMPEAVSAYVETGKLAEVSEVHHSILMTYQDDFPKYCGSRNLTRVQSVFNYVARNIGKKIKYSNISSDEQSLTLKKDIQLLCMARIMTKVIHSHANGVPLQAEQEDKHYKLLFLDVGLMNAMAGINAQSIRQLDDGQLITEGAIAEQFIGQHLLEMQSNRLNRDLNYWIRQSKSSNAEVDYVVALDGQVVPVEVKAGKSGSLRSLHQFMGEKELSVAVRFDANLPGCQQVEASLQKKQNSQVVNYQLLSLPLYLVERLEDILQGVS